jgi:H+/Cl- antiporter ClcA
MLSSRCLIWAARGVIFSLLVGGSAAMLAATTQGPISAIVLMMELTGFSRSAVLPLLLAVTTATLIARTIEPRSIYDARLTDTQVRDRQYARNRAMEESPT